MTDRVESAVGALERVRVPVTWSDVTERAEQRTGPDVALGPPSPRPRRRLLVAAAVLAVVAAFGAVAVTNDGQDQEPAETGPGPDNVPSTPVSQEWPRRGAVAVWTGDTYLVWGGSGRGDGWAFSPGADEVEPLPPAPIEGRSGGLGVWTGSELVVCCGFSETGTSSEVAGVAAYDPAAGTWRTLAEPPFSQSDQHGTAVWTGTEMIVVLSGRIGPTTMAALDVGANRWRLIEDAPPSLGTPPAAVWTGESVIVWERRKKVRLYHRDGRQETEPDTGFAYDPVSDAWVELAPMPAEHAVVEASIAWTGEELIVFGLAANGPPRATGLRSSLGQDWRPLPDPGLRPIDLYNGTPGSQALAWDHSMQRLVVWPPHGSEWGWQDDGSVGPLPLLGFDPFTDEWDQLTEPGLGFAPDLTAADGYVLQPLESDPIVTTPR